MQNSNEGIALPTGLIFLLILTLVALSSVSGTVNDTVMASSFDTRAQAYHCANATWNKMLHCETVGDCPRVQSVKIGDQEKITDQSKFDIYDVYDTPVRTNAELELAFNCNIQNSSSVAAINITGTTFEKGADGNRSIFKRDSYQISSNGNVRDAQHGVISTVFKEGVRSDN